MADSKRQKIMDKIDERLKTITGAPTYEVNFGSRVFDFRPVPIQDSELPAIVYRDSEEAVEPISGNDLETHSLTVEIEAVAASATPSRQARKMLADIVKAIKTDRTWAGLAIDTRLISQGLDVEQEQKAIGAITVRIEVIYRTNALDPYN